MGGCLSKKEEEESQAKTEEAPVHAVETAPAGTEESPARTEDAPASTDEAPVKTDGSSPGADETTPGENESTPGPDEPAPGADEAAPATDVASASDGETAKDSKPIVFVLGASGSVGSATVKTLSEEYSDKVQIRAGVRHPEGADKLHGLSGVTLVQACMADKDTLATLLVGVSALFIVSPGAENRAELTSLSAEAAKEAGVGHLVVVSLPMAVEEGTIFGRQFTEIEAKITGLGIPYTLLRLPYFMDNFLGLASTVKESGQIYMPVSSDKIFAVVDTDDAGKAAAAVLVDPSKHAEKTYHVVSARVTNDEIKTTLSTLLDKDVSFVQSETDATKQTLLGFGVAEWQADGILELFQLVEDGAPSILEENGGNFREITGEDPVSLKEYLTRHLTAFQ